MCKCSEAEMGLVCSRNSGKVSGAEAEQGQPVRESGKGQASARS